MTNEPGCDHDMQYESGPDKDGWTTYKCSKCPWRERTR